MDSILSTFSRADLNSPSEHGLVSDKMDVFFNAAKEVGIEVHHVLLPGESKWLLKSRYKFTRLPYFFRFWFFSMFSMTFRIFGLEGFRSAALQSKSRVLSEGWGHLLESTNASAVVGIGIPQELVRLAKLKGLPCIEFQHGLFDRHGVAKYWPEHFPSHMFCWDEYSAQEIRSLGIAAIVTGHPISFDERFFEETDLTKASIEDPSDLFCVALSYGEMEGLGPSKSITEEVIASITDSLEEGFEPIFRLHPVVARHRLKKFLLKSWLKKIWKGARIHDPSTVSIVDSASRSRFLLTSQSSSAYEFALLGKPSVVLDMSVARKIQESIIRSGLRKEFIYPSISSLNGFTNKEKVIVNSSLNQIDEFLKIIR